MKDIDFIAEIYYYIIKRGIRREGIGVLYKRRLFL